MERPTGKLIDSLMQRGDGRIIVRSTGGGDVIAYQQDGGIETFLQKKGGRLANVNQKGVELYYPEIFNSLNTQ